MDWVPADSFDLTFASPCPHEANFLLAYIILRQFALLMSFSLRFIVPLRVVSFSLLWMLGGCLGFFRARLNDWLLILDGLCNDLLFFLDHLTSLGLLWSRYLDPRRLQLFIGLFSFVCSLLLCSDIRYSLSFDLHRVVDKLKRSRNRIINSLGPGIGSL